MVHKVKSEFKDRSLLYLARTLRCISNGIIAIIFLQNLYLKGFSEQWVGLLQTIVMLSHRYITYYLTTKVKEIRLINSLIIFSILKSIAGFIYAKSQDPMFLVLAAILGMISVTGRETGPFVTIQKSILCQMMGGKVNQEQNSQELKSSLKWYKWLGYIGNAVGVLIACSYSMLNTLVLKGFQEEAVTNMMFGYAILSGLIAMIYYGMDFVNVKTNEESKNQQIKQPCAGSHNKFWIFLYCLAGYGEGWVLYLVTPTYLFFYFYDKYFQSMLNLGMIMTSFIIASGISLYISPKICQKLGQIPAYYLFLFPSCVLLILTSIYTRQAWSIASLILYFLFSRLHDPIKSRFKKMILPQSDRLASSGIQNMCHFIGIACGLILGGQMMSPNPDDLGFSVPILVLGAIKITAGLVMTMYLAFSATQHSQSEIGQKKCDICGDQKQQKQALCPAQHL